MALLYAREGKLYASQFLEIYVPTDYEEDNFMVDQGITVETFGLLFVRGITDGIEGPIQLLNIPTMITIQVYDSSSGTINVHGQQVDVMICRYLPNSLVMGQTIIEGRDKAETFLKLVMAGKLPRVLNYGRLADIWWRNLEISGISFNVPSKIYELILATVYRARGNPKKRYGEIYGKGNSSGYDYETASVRDIVASLSTFSGIAFEYMNKMITSGINNSLEGVEEPISPLEKIIHY